VRTKSKRKNGVNEFRAHGGRSKRRRSPPQERREAICVHLQAQRQAHSSLARRRNLSFCQVSPSSLSLFFLLYNLFNW